MRGATYSQNINLIHTTFQSTLPMRGATMVEKAIADSGIFQSTLPMRGATKLLMISPVVLSISIHTPHAGSDDY